MDENWLEDAILEQAREAVPEMVEETVIAAVGHDGRRQLDISIDFSDPEMPKISVKGPADLKAKVDAAFKARFGREAQ